MQELPADYQHVITLRSYEGYSFEQIGRELNRTPEAARRLWSRAVGNCRIHWLNDHDPCTDTIRGLVG